MALCERELFNYFYKYQWVISNGVVLAVEWRHELTESLVVSSKEIARGNEIWI